MEFMKLDRPIDKKDYGKWVKNYRGVLGLILDPDIFDPEREIIYDNPVLVLWPKVDDASLDECLVGMYACGKFAKEYHSVYDVEYIEDRD